MTKAEAAWRRASSTGKRYRSRRWRNIWGRKVWRRDK